MTERKPKILFVGPEQGDHLYNWIKPFRDEFEIHTLTLHPDIPVDGVSHHHMKLFFHSRLDFFSCRWQAQKIIDEVKPDIIHAHYLSSYGILLAMLCFKGPKFLSVWGSDVNKSEKSLFLKPICAWAAKHFSYINSPSEHIKDTLKSWGVQENRIEVYQYGILTEQILPKIQSPDKRIRLVSFRDWAPIYKIDYIVESFNKFLQESPVDIELHLYGRRTKEQEAHILGLVEQCPQPHKIIVHPFTRREHLMEKLRSMDAFFSVPKMDGMPLSLLEGLYIGLVPLLSDIPANREWMMGTELPWIKDYSYDEFKAAMNYVITQRHRFEILKHKEKVSKYADFNKNIALLRSRYLSFIEKAP
jgi:hypothetical protein